jgi:acetyl esterase
MSDLRSRVEAALFRTAMGLPAPVVRLLAGRSVKRDGQVLDPETQWMLRLERVAGEPAVETLPIVEGRRVLRRQTLLAGGKQPIGQVCDLEVPTPAGPLRARLYIPSSQVPGIPTRGADWRRTPVDDTPLLVFLHGGGMIYGDLDTHDATCRMLAERADIRVLALDYRLAPEHRYPAAVEDCWAGFQWAVEHADELGADQHRVAVGGDSAGAYLAAVVAIKAAEAGVPCVFQLLVYPVTNHVDVSESRKKFGEGFYLTHAFMDLAVESYLAPTDDRADPMVSVQLTEKIPEGLAPALVVTAGFDPLRDEGEEYARTLADAGVSVELRRYPGFIHGFFNVVGVGRANRAAVAEIAAKLKAGIRA